MTGLAVGEAAVLAVAAFGAGGINTLVGSGTLLTFPALLAVGLPPVSANITNNVGLVVGSVSGTWGYRRELAGQRGRLARLLPASAVGGLLGALLLLLLPAEVFEGVVPVLVAAGVALVLVQPWLSRRAAAAARRHLAAGGVAGWGPPSAAGQAGLVAGVVLAGIYGGYFGAAQGILLLGIMGGLIAEHVQRLNAVKNALAGTVNLLATVLFLVAAPGQVNWPAAGVVAVGAALGGIVAARYGRRLAAPVLRAVIVVVGVVAVVALVVL